VPERAKRAPVLPPGWRWLKAGEYARPGDVLCDRRVKPVTIAHGFGPLDAGHHPIRRQLSRDLMPVGDVIVQIKRCFGTGVRGVQGFAVTAVTDDGTRLRLQYGKTGFKR
jgi:hypothetical protein